MKALARTIGHVNRAITSMAGLLIAVVMLVVCADIAVRLLTGGSIHGAIETAVLLLVALVFLGLGGAEATGENFAVTILVQRLPNGIRRGIEAFGRLVSFALVGLLAWFCWNKAFASFQAGEKSYGVIAFPIWPSRFLVAIGLTLLAAQFLATLVTGVRQPDDLTGDTHVGPALGEEGAGR